MLGYNYSMDDFLSETTPSPERGLTAEERRTLDGLLFILNHEPSLNLRLKAVRALSRFKEMSALRTLAEIALYEEDEPVRRAAYQELDNLFGEGSEAFIESIRLEIEGEEDDEEENELFPLSSVNTSQSSPQNMSDYSFPPVMREEGTPLWLWAALALFILGGIVLFVLR
mgnify:CR=1 FL=1|uniref:HEAT repeat domain-containing protein n=1 Tax=Bellilinea caldifistulae TaxID=360411 RepID=A0A7C4L312_9CHLR